jgi:hypothetical protein
MRQLSVMSPLAARLRIPALALVLAALAVGQPQAQTARAAAPEPPLSPEVTVTGEALTPDNRLGRWRADIAVPPDAATNPVLDPRAEGAEAGFLRRWMRQGTAAGLAGVFYDNRDNGHSRLDPRRFPQLAHIRYGRDLRERQMHRSLAHELLFPGPVLGNASLAVTAGIYARSLPRLAMSSQHAITQAFVGYASNHLYVYPGHHDVGHDRGDILPAMVPYFAISEGSSGTDRPVLDALALALASMQPATRARMEEAGLVAPTLTMLLRLGLNGADGYLEPAAHPPAIHRSRLRRGAMMAAAQAMAPDEIPPMVTLRVLIEDFAEAAGLDGRSERLFDTPSAVARLWRGWDWTRSMVVSTAGTRDPNGRPLEFRWVLVSGDPERVRIVPLDADGRRARIEIDWHDAPFVPEPGAEPRSRIEIAVIAWNGAWHSAPAFVTVVFPAHEERAYAPGPDGVMRLASVDYDARRRSVEFDPQFWWEARWRDEPILDAALQRTGWRRVLRDGSAVEVSDAAPGSYELRQRGRWPPRLQWTSAPAPDGSAGSID